MYRLAIVTTHPIQYQAPWFRALAAHPDLEIEVLFCHNATSREQAQAGFGVEFNWDTPLLEGYPNRFLHNVARKPSIGTFQGLDVPEIAAIIRQEHFDAVLVSGWNYKGAWQAFRACWQTRMPVMVRGDSHLRTQRHLLKRTLKYPFYRWFISRMDACLAVGKWSHEYYVHYGASPDRVFLVPHVVDEDRFSGEAGRLAPVRTESRARWSIPVHSIVFLFCGKLNAQKRPLDFVQAVGYAHERDPAIIGLIVGDGPLRTDCENLTATQDIPVRIAGFLNQSEMPNAYAAADALVLPSEGETWGLVVNEAMLSGRPCIVSDQVGCGPDLIVPEQTGDVFQCGNIAGLSKLMVNYAMDHQSLADMGKRARALVTQRYSLKVATVNVVAALREVARVGGSSYAARDH